MEDINYLESEIAQLNKRLDEMKEKLHNLTRICVIDTHTNVPHYRVMEANVDKPRIKNKDTLIGVKPNNCTVKLDFGGVKIPILDREVSLRICMYFPMTCHNFDIWMTPIDSEQDYSIELKYTDDDAYTSRKIRDIKNHNDELVYVIQNMGMFGLTNIKPIEDPVRDGI